MDKVKEFYTKFYDKLSKTYDFIFGNFIRQLFTKPASIVFLGIDNAGKTSLVRKLKRGTNETYMPTRHASKSDIEIGNLKATVVDVGGHKQARVVWSNYFYNCDGIIFIVDTSDPERFSEVNVAYKEVRKFEKKAPIAVLMNKIDLCGKTEDDVEWCEDIKKKTGIFDHPGSEEEQPVNVAWVSIVKESSEALTGPLAMSFKWLEMMINKKTTN
ncbi:small coPII coat GTPase (SAR1) [Vairimorpha necatrix]|uniref:Small coPII coat GTPase (SAR1) n=1 Tax=Vairimorpha necatrix TaxID=6039 RepID=A0AAX4JFA0_9MICR